MNRAACGICLMVALAGPALAIGQPAAPVPELRAGALTGAFKLDGVLDEADWLSAPAIDALTMSEPTAGARPSATTRVRVIADTHALVIGVVCDDPDAAHIVSFTKQRDAVLGAEDNIKMVLDTFFDGGSGYVFQVNPSGARYDEAGMASVDR